MLANVRDDSVGATVLFLGTVRNHNDGYTVSGIYYEAYVRMAEEAMAKIEEETIKRWNLKKFAAVHRVGNLKIGEVSVAIAVSSEHRAEAFEAGRYAIDRIKTEVPIWKKEIIRGRGEMWAQGTPIGES
ncbi:MAG: molybdenum cofactor biosynthesis protein MoaE [Thermoproteota archaeon]|nr:molybdenum cofactor biosynthesis protein MoaE [Thermoproteota archaeon]